MIFDYQTLSTAFFGFIGGIFGGVAINRISYFLQKKDERKDAISMEKLEYKNNLKNKLSEIAQTIQSTLRIEYELDLFKNELKIFSTQLTSILSKRPIDISPEIEDKLLGVDDSLRELSYYFYGIGSEIENEFELKCEELVERIIFNVLPEIDLQLFEQE
ncbi:hypothetical protein RE476_02880 [Methanolobus mangrovi]|uniref:Uncharacterized protein n=1 Tax=Methanolobus mangrovi TaxID=3072977 RepID=A0AA51UGF0_9EURY|nr:hypothetical protein [Methanolobus mangrovi]WMW22784.1 hypothetical protein RE476_02880 [Methanolobus mangrovi]